MIRWPWKWTWSIKAWMDKRKLVTSPSQRCARCFQPHWGFHLCPVDVTYRQCPKCWQSYIGQHFCPGDMTISAIAYERALADIGEIIKYTVREELRAAAQEVIRRSRKGKRKSRE